MESKAGYDNSYWKGVFLFVADKGYKDAFLQDITCEEGTSTAYPRFGNKEGLFWAIAEPVWTGKHFATITIFIQCLVVQCFKSFLLI